MKLNKKVVKVTGGASEFGFVTCQELSKQGEKIVVFDLNEDAGKLLVTGLGDNVIFAKVGVTDETPIAKGIQQAINTFGSIHVCINCAGIISGGKTVGRFGALALNIFAQVININLAGSFNVLRLAAEQMAKNEPDVKGDRGVIINTASVAAFDGQIGQAVYSASRGDSSDDLTNCPKPSPTWHPYHGHCPWHLRYADEERDE